MGFQYFMPSLMQVVLPGHNRDEIANGEDRRRTLLEKSSRQGLGCYDIEELLHSISIQVALWASVVGNEPFHSFHSNLARQLLWGKATEDRR